MKCCSSSVFVYFVDTIKVAGDTELTPFWAFSICLWSEYMLPSDFVIFGSRKKSGVVNRL